MTILAGGWGAGRSPSSQAGGTYGALGRQRWRLGEMRPPWGPEDVPGGGSGLGEEMQRGGAMPPVNRLELCLPIVPGATCTVSHSSITAGWCGTPACAVRGGGRRRHTHTGDWDAVISRLMRTRLLCDFMSARDWSQPMLWDERP